MAFQIVDDVLDIVGDSNTMGKSLFSDLKEGKMTYPLIAMSTDPRGASILQELQLLDLESPRAVAFFESMRCWMISNKIPEQSLALATEFCNEATRSLEGFSNSLAKEALIQVAQAIAIRKQ